MVAKKWISDISDKFSKTEKQVSRIQRALDSIGHKSFGPNQVHTASF